MDISESPKPATLSIIKNCTETPTCTWSHPAHGTVGTRHNRREGSLGGDWLCGESVRVLALFLVLFVAAVVITLTIFWHVSCSLDDFECNNSTCLSQEKFCDSYEDCAYGEDEKESYCRISDKQYSFKIGSSGQAKLDIESVCNLSGFPTAKDDHKLLKILSQRKGIDRYGTDNSSILTRSQLFQEERKKHILQLWDDKTTTMEGQKLSYCTCGMLSVLKCYNLKKIPDGVNGKVTKLIMEGNLESIASGDLDRYSHLEKGLYLHKNRLTSLPNRVFEKQTKLQQLYLYENRISNISEESFLGLSNLEILQLHMNNLHTLNLSCLSYMEKLVDLLLSSNFLTLDNEEFPTLPRLKVLFLQRNQVHSVSAKLFSKLTNLETLSLQNNKIVYIHPRAFDNLEKLQALDLSRNLLTTVAEIFNTLRNLKSLNLRGLSLDSSKPRDYENLTALEVVYFPRIRYCHYIKNVTHCEPRSDGITTKEDMVHSVILRVSIWVVAVLTLCGNAAVIWSRGISKGDDKILVLFLKHLAVADLLMGVYLCIVGIQDQRTRGSFSDYAIEWTSSKWCSAAAILALVSSEASVFILAFMSLQRYLHLTRSIYGGELSKRFALRSLLIIWLTSIVIALFPAALMSSFYGINSMCFPLHISEPYLEGWEFSAFVFLGLNSFCVIVIIGSYVGLFINIQLTRSDTPLSNTEVSIAVRFLFIVLTDCVCWLPILIFKIIALAGVPIPGQPYAWLVVLVLPVNSAINPILYTFSTNHFIANIKSGFNNAWPNWDRKISVLPSTETSCTSSRRSQSSSYSGGSQLGGSSSRRATLCDGTGRQ